MYKGDNRFEAENYTSRFLTTFLPFSPSLSRTSFRGYEEKAVVKLPRLDTVVK